MIFAKHNLSVTLSPCHLVTLSSCLLLALSPAVSAQEQPPKRWKPRINDVRVGFPPVRDPNRAVDPTRALYKAGFWTPVYVNVTAGDDPMQDGQLLAETTDTDDVKNNYTSPVQRLDGREALLGAMTYTKTGSTDSEVKVTLKTADQLYPYNDNQHFPAIPPGDVLYLSLGSMPLELQGYLSPPDQANAAQANQAGKLYGHAAYLDNVQRMPNRWFGYAAADLVILTTSKREFVNDLLNEKENRKQALAEWVRRGGRLVISAGKYPDAMRDLLDKMAMPLPVEVTGQPILPQRDRLHMVETWARVSAPEPFTNRHPLEKAGAGKPPPIDVAKLERKPGKEVEVLLKLDEDKDSPFLIARMPFGMGQVTLVAFDLDAEPFTSWVTKAEGFWKQFLEKTSTPVQVTSSEDMNQMQQWRVPNQRQGEGSDLATNIQSRLEIIDDVPVISFGYVAVFILVYILIVGPLDYFFLKKVLKRLELTWITFPTVVLLVSAIAYFAAYSLKGNDQKINKLDLIDIDLSSQQVYGNTFFTIFSPRIQLYNIGVEPVSPEWGMNPENGKKPAPVVVTWMGKPETGYGGFNRPRSQTLFPRTYEYEPDAAGLKGVPIQVWSLKAFTGTWELPFNPAGVPITASLVHPPGDIQKISGEITNQLPVNLEDAYLVYDGGRNRPQVFKLDKPLLPNNAKRITLSRQAGEVKGLTEWMAENIPSAQMGSPQGKIISSLGLEGTIRRLWFYDKDGNKSSTRDYALRYLDEGWRLSAKKDEVILVARVAPMTPSGTALKQEAEAVTQYPGTASRLWIGQLPSAKGARPALTGTMVQETFVRIFIPVKTAEE